MTKYLAPTVRVNHAYTRRSNTFPVIDPTERWLENILIQALKESHLESTAAGNPIRTLNL